MINLLHEKDLENCVKGIKDLVILKEDLEKKQYDEYIKSDEFRRKLLKAKKESEKRDDPKEILKMKLKIKKQQRSKKLTDKQIKKLKQPKKNRKKVLKKPPTLE